MRKKRILVMGPEKSGKTTLISRIEGPEVPIRRIANMVYRPTTVDAPGAYLECPWMQMHLIAAAQDAACIVMVSDAAGKKRAYPPGFAKVFRVPILGAVTRCDLPDADPEAAARELREAGVPEPIFFLSIREPDEMNRFLRAVSIWKPREPDSHETTESIRGI